MDIFYFLVTSLEAYKDQYGFHSAYFADGSGFMAGLLLSLGIGVVLALCFYFGLCNGKSAKPATRANWWVTLLLVVISTYFICEMDDGRNIYATPPQVRFLDTADLNKEEVDDEC